MSVYYFVLFAAPVSSTTGTLQSREKKAPNLHQRKTLITFDPFFSSYESIKCWLEVIKSNPDAYYTVELHIVEKEMRDRDRKQGSKLNNPNLVGVNGFAAYIDEDH
ncbi:hypothetical protein HKD37_17G047072 [Glycine soja]